MLSSFIVKKNIQGKRKGKNSKQNYVFYFYFIKFTFSGIRIIVYNVYLLYVSSKHITYIFNRIKFSNV